VGAYGVNIIGLSNKVHQFEYEIGDAFFRQYGTGLLEGGQFHADVTLNKHETFIEADFKIKGTAKLICDRSLEQFEEAVKTHRMVVFKFGEANEEISDEIVMIHRDTATLELGQYIYEFIGLAIPMKKLHPKFRVEENEGDEDGQIVYRSGPDAGDDDDDDQSDTTDPRWDILKKLK